MEVEFSKMRRTELQRCAKKAGIRANIKTEELIKALVTHHMKSSDDNSSQAPQQKSKNLPQDTVDEQTECVQGAMTTSSSETMTSEDEAKPSRCQRGGRGGRKGRKKVTLKKQEQANTVEGVTQPESEVTTAAPGKKATPVQPKQQSRTSKRKSPPVSVTPKSAQKRSHSDTEDAEFPPAKQQKVSPQGKESTPERRSSTRKRTFSMSPPKLERDQTDGNKENDPSATENSGTRRSRTKVKRSASLGTIVKKATPKQTPQKPLPKKSTAAAVKTGIPLPKIKPSEPVTPGKPIDLKKAHKKQLNQLESIDDYLERKRKRIEALTQSYKKKKPTSAKKTPSQRKTVSTPKEAKPTNKRTSFFSPKPDPTVKQTSITKSVKFQKSKLKTPARKSTFVFGKTSTEKRVATPGARKSVALMNVSANFKTFSVNSTTPFKFGDKSTIATPAKPKFDLKASLEKPLAYKPYSGKLKPLTEVKSSNAKKPTSHVTKAKENMKKPKLAGRAQRQKAVAAQRVSSRNNNAMARRGLV